MRIIWNKRKEDKIMGKKEIREQVKRKLQKSINTHIQKIYNEIDKINEELRQSNELGLIYQALVNAEKDKASKRIYEDKLRQYQELQKLLHEKKDMLFAIAHEMALVVINFKKE